MRRFAAAAAVLVVLAAAAVSASEALRVQADGVAALPARKRGDPAPRPPDAATLRALRQTALTNGIETAVLSYASQLAREETRADEAALRSALGDLAGYTLGHGVLADLGPREVQPKLLPGDPPPHPRLASDPVPMEHAWRIEAIVDAERVLAALQSAGLAFASGEAGGTAFEVVLEAPYDAQGLAALRARLTALGAERVVPRRFSAEAVALSVRGLSAELLLRRLASEPPSGFSAETRASDVEAGAVRVRLTPAPPQPAASAP